MLPFLELPMTIVNNEEKQKEVIGRIQPTEVADYYPGFYEGTVVVLKSGSSLHTPLSVEEVDNALAAYHSFIKANTGKFGNLKLTPKKPLLHAAD
jgi:hypothetical protein